MDRVCVLRSLSGGCTNVKMIVIAMLFFASCYLPSAVAADRFMVTFLRGEHDWSLRAGGRTLQGDSSPPGLWTGDDDDESLHARRRALLSDLRDTSPPRLWTGDDDDESLHERRRAFLFDLLDSSPPDSWLDGDDEQFQATKRALLSALDDVSPHSFTGGDKDDEYYHDERRALLYYLCNFSPPGLWPSGNDNHDELLVHRRSHLANSKIHQLQTQSAPAEDGGHGIRPPQDNPSRIPPRITLSEKYRLHPRHGSASQEPAQVDTSVADRLSQSKTRSLLFSLRDISPPGVGYGDDDDDETVVNRRRSLLSNRSDAALHGGMTVVDHGRQNTDGSVKEQTVRESPPCDSETSSSMPVAGDEIQFQRVHRKLCAPQNASSSTGQLVEAAGGWFWKRSRQFMTKLVQYYLRFLTISGCNYPSPTVRQGDEREGTFSPSTSALQKLTNGDTTGGQVLQSHQAVSFVSPARMELPSPLQVQRLSFPDILFDERGFMSS